MRLLYITIVCLSILATFGCKSESKPEPDKKSNHIFAKYYVRYLQSEKELKAEVSFKKGDSLATARSIVLADVSFQNEPMEVQDLGKIHGVRYSSRKTGLYKDQYQFNYSSQVLGPLNHLVKMSPITDFSFKENKIDKTSGTTLSWEGGPLLANQELILLFTDEQKKAFPVQIKGPTKKPEIFLSNKKIEGLTIGIGQLMLVKKQITQTTENNFSKVSEMEFYSKHLDIEVTE